MWIERACRTPSSAATIRWRSRRSSGRSTVICPCLPTCASQGFNGFEFAQYVRPRLTTVVSPAYEMGKRGAALLLKRLSNNAFEQTDVLFDVVAAAGRLRTDPGESVSPSSTMSLQETVTRSAADVGVSPAPCVCGQIEFSSARRSSTGSSHEAGKSFGTLGLSPKSS